MLAASQAVDGGRLVQLPIILDCFGGAAPLMPTDASVVRLGNRDAVCTLDERPSAPGLIYAILTLRNQGSCMEHIQFVDERRCKVGENNTKEW